METINTDSMQPDEVVLVSMACRADACNQGRSACPCPYACMVAEDAGAGAGVILWPVLTVMALVVWLVFF